MLPTLGSDASAAIACLIFGLGLLMNPIATQQNTAKQLERPAAQRQLYSTASVGNDTFDKKGAPTSLPEMTRNEGVASLPSMLTGPPPTYDGSMKPPVMAIFLRSMRFCT